MSLDISTTNVDAVTFRAVVELLLIIEFLQRQAILAAEWELCLHLQERLAAVIKAEGESEAARLISEATKTYGLGMIELRRVEAAKEIAATLSKGRNVVYLPSTGNMLLSLQT
jgi:regulator of protease activity HflC (stomatin/prohibitin superfamily)